MEFIECEIDGVELRVYACGKIESFYRNCYWHEIGFIRKNSNHTYERVCVELNNKKYAVSRIIYHVFCNEEFDIDNPLQEIDHINQNPLDNRIENLRVVSHTQNVWNRNYGKGVSYKININKWIARITVNKRTIHLGSFATEDEAKQAYLSAKEKYHIIC
jgi:hypothetical protein